MPTTLGQTYQVVTTTDLAGNTWTAVGTPITGAGNAVSVTNSAAGQQGFYLLELIQQ